MPDASSLRAASPQRPKSALLRSPERKARVENGGEGGRRGNTEEQYGRVNWSGTLREKVWDDKLNRYVGVNPAAELGEDWRMSEKKRRPKSALVLGTRGLSGGHKMTGVAASNMWESTHWQASNAERLPQPERVFRPSSGFSRRSTMDPASTDWSAKHTIGHTRPSTAGRVQHVSTQPRARFDQWDLTHRPNTSTTVDSRSHFSSTSKSRASRRSVSSSGSDASTMSFLDKYSTSDKKTQRLLMMQKKMELSDAMTKKAQLSLGRPCTPEMVRALGTEMNKELDGTVRRDKLESAFQQSVLEESDNDHRPAGEQDIDHNVLNHDGKFSFAEVAYGTQELNAQVENVTQRLGLDTLGGSGGFRSVARGSDFDDASSRHKSFEGSCPSEKSSSGANITMPWRGKHDAAVKEGKTRKSMSHSGSLVINLYTTLKETTSREQLYNMLQQCVSTGPLDEGCCSFADFQATLLGLSIRLSKMEARWFTRHFKGHTPLADSFNYKLFIDTFWPHSEQRAETVSAGKREAAVASLIANLRMLILKYIEQSGSGIPPAVTMLTKFHAHDGLRSGFVSTEAVAEALQQFDISPSGALGQNGLQLMGQHFGRGGSSEHIDYVQLIGALLPPELSMAAAPQRLSKAAEPSGGIVGKSTTAGQGPGVARTFYDVVKKIKLETHGNRAILEQCFKLQDPDGTGTISPEALAQALLLLRISMGRKAITTCFGLFHVSHDLIDYQKLLNDIFPAGATMQQNDALQDALAHDLEREIYSRCKSQFPTLLVAFRELTGTENSFSRRALGVALQEKFHMQPDPTTLDTLWSRWDPHNSDSICFQDFAAVFRDKKMASNMIKTKDVKEVKRLVQEAINARLNGSGGGDLLKAFQYFDRDRSGRLSYEKMTAGLNSYTGLQLDEGMCALLMEEYDPERVGYIDFNGFASHVMGSRRGENLSFNNEFMASAATKAPATWSLPQLEAAIKKKMEKSWTQMLSDLQTADLDGSCTLSKEDLRGLLAKFAFSLDDKVFEQLCMKFNPSANGEVSIDAFMQYFAKLDGMEGILLSPGMTVEAAQKFIAEKIEGRLQPGNGGLLRAYQMFDRDRSGHIDYDEFEQVLQETCLIRLHPQIKQKLMKLYDPSGQGHIDSFGFARYVMGSTPGAGTSYDNEEPKDPQQSDTMIHKRWDFEAVEDCLRRRLVGERGRRCAEALNSCDMDRRGYVHVDELRAVLDAEKLDMTAAQWKEFIRNFDLTAHKTLRSKDFVDAFVTLDADEDTGHGDPHWAGRSVEDVVNIVQRRINERIGAGPQEGFRTWKYFNESTDKSSTLSVASLREKFRNHLNLDLSKDMCEQLAEHYAAGDECKEINFNGFVKRILQSTNEEPKSLVPVEACKAAITHSGGNSEMFIRNKVRSAWRDLVQAFRLADNNDSGSLSTADLRSILHRFSIDLTPKQFAELLREIDASDTGSVKYREFMSFFQKKEAPSQRVSIAKMPVSVAVTTMVEKLNLKFSGLYTSEELRKTLTRADRDQRGTLSLNELQAALAHATGLEPELEHVVALLRHYGIDHSFDVDYNEFVYRMMMGGGTTGLDTRRVFSHAGGATSHADRAVHRPDIAAPVGVSHILQQIAQRKTHGNLPVLMRSFDENNSGTLSYAQFLRALAALNLQLTAAERDALCSHVDSRGSGEIE